MVGFFKLLLMCAALFALSLMFFINNAPQRAAQNNTAASNAQGLVMYSLSTCGRCTVKRHELQRANIPFEEYFLDKDPSVRNRLSAKLTASGIPGGRVGTPVFEVNGKMITGNPPLRKVLQHLGE